MRALELVLGVAVAYVASACVPQENEGEGSDNELRRGDPRAWVDTVVTGSPPSDCEENTLPSDTLEEFALKCDLATGITVPDFDCDDGTVVPTTVHGESAWVSPENGGTDAYIPDVPLCDRPNVLNHECDPGSRFQVLVETEEAIAVAHCRKRGRASGEYGDIAVIQYNRVNGATCFYQALGTLDGDVRAPQLGQSEYDWLSPAQTESINCVGCHDNGPFIRSPYLAQLSEEPENRLPGTHDGGETPWDHRFSWNSTQPYRFVGNDFQSWRAYSVSHTGEGALCTGCHRMGTNSTEGVFSSSGTARRLGLIATDESQAAKLEHSQTSPIWMTPFQTTYSEANAQAADAIADCAAQLAQGISDETCNMVLFGQGWTCPDATVMTTINGATQAEEQVAGPSHTVIDLPACAPGECDNPGFCYFSSVHGPFRQWSGGEVTPGSDDYRGTYVRIFTGDGHWKVESFSHALNDAPIAPPGGTIECVGFAEIETVSDPLTCWGHSDRVIDPLGTLHHDAVALAPTAHAVGPLGGLIGNIAISNGPTSRRRGYPRDAVRLLDVGGNLELAFWHGQRLPPKALGIEAFAFGCDDWEPEYVVRDAYSTGDIQLVGAGDAQDVRCFITGLTGTWDVTHANGTVQPFAEIYWGPSGDRRLRVLPTDASSGAPAGVGAYASCIRLQD